MHDILLTGATGFLGHYLLAELLREPSVRCRLMLRPPMHGGAQRLATLVGDLGLDLDSLRAAGRVELLEGELPDHRPDASRLSGVTCVVHAAANTSFDADRTGEPARTNLDGTRAMLHLAGEAGIRRFVLVSTAFVCGDRRGRIAERVSPRAPTFANVYEQSKWEAEQLVWAWRGAERIATICRPTILFGDSTRGRATVMNGLYLIARATEILSRAVTDDAEADRHQVPLRIIGDPRATINAIPVDYAARRIAGIALDGAAESSVHHIANPQPPTHEEIKKWLEQYFDLAGGRFCRSDWPLEDPNRFEELFYSRSNAVQDYFRCDLSFESRDGEETDRVRLIDRERFFRALRYAQATNWGRECRARTRARRAPQRVRPDWYFNEFLPRTLPRSQVARVDALTTTARFVICGCDDGEWVCRFENGELAQLSAGPNGLQEAFGYRVSVDEFADVVTGRRPVQDAFFEGGAEMFGDIDQALKMVSIIEKFVAEFPVREAAGRR
ncbi:MAG: SDR family oxidoreductase [Phycisphaerae bacterium]|jgi:nucleoside-diphosphate-sugar epimerase